MGHDEPTYRDYAVWARQSLEDIARDCHVQAFRASGPGGQCVNTTDSAVRMTHVPSGMTVTSHESRSQFRNRQLCLQKLRDRFVREAVPPKARRATKATRASKERRLARSAGAPKRRRSAAASTSDAGDQPVRSLRGWASSRGAGLPQRFLPNFLFRRTSPS